MDGRRDEHTFIWLRGPPKLYFRGAGYYFSVHVSGQSGYEVAMAEDFFLFPSLPHQLSSTAQVSKPLGISTAENPDLWRHWLQQCLKSHTHCWLSQNTGFSPSRLIQILPNGADNACERWRLVLNKQNGPVQYLTLSHCWGKSLHVRLTRASLPIFTQDCTISSLPKTYQHAMEVTRTLGFDHMWIDSLCIIQDDMADWEREASLMASVYKNAQCKIAATSAADGDGGCFYKRDPCLVAPTEIVSDPEMRHSPTYRLCQGADGYPDDMTAAALNTRAWVVQERCLAPRQICFSGEQAYWECAESTASEEFQNGLPESLWKTSSDTLRPPATPKPSLIAGLSNRELRETWCSLVATFSSSYLTKSSDKSMAIAGLAELYRDVTKDTYLAGLWKDDLLTQLC